MSWPRLSSKWHGTLPLHVFVYFQFPPKPSAQNVAKRLRGSPLRHHKNINGKTLWVFNVSARKILTHRYGYLLRNLWWCSGPARSPLFPSASLATFCNKQLTLTGNTKLLLMQTNLKRAEISIFAFMYQISQLIFTPIQWGLNSPAKSGAWIMKARKNGRSYIGRTGKRRNLIFSPANLLIALTPT